MLCSSKESSGTGREQDCRSDQENRQAESGLFSMENQRLRGDVTADYKCIAKGMLGEDKAYLN